MSTIPVYTFTGIIGQPTPAIRNCSFEALRQEYGMTVPGTVIQSSSDSVFECNESEYSWNDLQVLHQQFEVINENTINGFWKKRLIVHLLVSESFFSATFIPSALAPTENRILYVQKGGDKEIGFTAPYFLRDLKVREYDQASGINLLPIWDDDSIQRTTQDISEQVRPDLQESLEYFLRDTTTSRLGLAFYDRDQIVIRGWIKV